MEIYLRNRKEKSDSSSILKNNKNNNHTNTNSALSGATNGYSCIKSTKQNSIFVLTVTSLLGRNFLIIVPNKNVEASEIISLAMKSFRRLHPTAELPYFNSIFNISKRKTISLTEKIEKNISSKDLIEISNASNENYNNINMINPILNENQKYDEFQVYFYRPSLGFSMKKYKKYIIVENKFPFSVAACYERIIPGVLIVKIGSFLMHPETSVNEAKEIIKNNKKAPLCIIFRTNQLKIKESNRLSPKIIQKSDRHIAEYASSGNPRRLSNYNANDIPKDLKLKIKNYNSIQRYETSKSSFKTGYDMKINNPSKDSKSSLHLSQENPEMEDNNENNQEEEDEFLKTEEKLLLPNISNTGYSIKKVSKSSNSIAKDSTLQVLNENKNIEINNLSHKIDEGFNGCKDTKIDKITNEKKKVMNKLEENTGYKVTKVSRSPVPVSSPILQNKTTKFISENTKNGSNINYNKYELKETLNKTIEKIEKVAISPNLKNSAYTVTKVSGTSVKNSTNISDYIQNKISNITHTNIYNKTEKNKLSKSISDPSLIDPISITNGQNYEHTKEIINNMNSLLINRKENNLLTEEKKQLEYSNIEYNKKEEVLKNKINVLKNELIEKQHEINKIKYQIDTFETELNIMMKDKVKNDTENNKKPQKLTAKALYEMNKLNNTLGQYNRFGFNILSRSEKAPSEAHSNITYLPSNLKDSEKILSLKNGRPPRPQNKINKSKNEFKKIKKTNDIDTVSVKSIRSTCSIDRRSFQNKNKKLYENNNKYLNDRHSYIEKSTKSPGIGSYYIPPSSFSKGISISKAPIKRDTYIRQTESPGVGAYSIKKYERIKGGEIGDSTRELSWLKR